VSPHQSSTPRKRSLPVFQIALLVLLLLLCAVGIVSSTAQAPQGNSAVSPQQRELEDRIPKHLPIKVKVKNLNNEKWERDLEIEVKNEADKPIYYLDMYLVLSEVRSPDGHEIGFPLRYGRIELTEFDAPIEPTDIPIRPGDTYVFKIAEKSLEGWEVFKRGKPDPKKFRLIFASINFGDGTGFLSRDGVPIDIPK
jgi:hypothetical protein